MKKIYTIIVLLLMENTAFAGDDSEFLIVAFFNQTIGYQIGYSSSQQPVMQAFDCNGYYFIFVNGGYNYQSNIGSKVFFGVGLSSLLQIQYGYAFRSKTPILRLRSDWPLFIIKRGYWQCFTSTIGVFAENRFGNNSTSGGYNLGVSVGISIFDIISGYPRYRKYRNDQQIYRKYRDEWKKLK